MHNSLDTLSWFSVVFTYRDRGSWPHTLFWVFVGLSEGERGTFVSAGCVGLCVAASLH